MEKKIAKINEEIALIENKITNLNKDLVGTAETYSRITGYYRMTEFWNDGKKQEFSERLEYNF